MDIIYGAAGGGVVGLLALIFWTIVIAHLRRTYQERDELREKRMTDIETELHKHIECDQTQRILTKLEEMEKAANERQRSINNVLETLTSKVDRSLEKNAGQESQLRNHESFIRNLREDLQTHILRGVKRNADN